MKTNIVKTTTKPFNIQNYLTTSEDIEAFEIAVAEYKDDAYSKRAEKEIQLAKSKLNKTQGLDASEELEHSGIGL